MTKSVHREDLDGDIIAVLKAKKKTKKHQPPPKKKPNKPKKPPQQKSSVYDIRSDSDQVGRKIGSLSHFLIFNGSPQAIEGEAKNHDAQFGKLSENKNRQ